METPEEEQIPTYDPYDITHLDPSGPFDEEDQKPPKFFPKKYITRRQWGSTYADSKDFEFEFAKSIVLTFTGSDPCSDNTQCSKAMKEAQLSDKALGLPDIRHNFVVGGDGYVYEGRSWLENPDVPEKHKEDLPNILSIGLIGRFGDTPSEEQEKALEDLLTIGKTQSLIIPKPEMYTYFDENPFSKKLNS